MANFSNVLEFQQGAKQNIGAAGANLYKSLIIEEYGELIEAVRDDNKVEILDALVDLSWVIVGYLNCFPGGHSYVAALNDQLDKYRVSQPNLHAARYLLPRFKRETIMLIGDRSDNLAEWADQVLMLMAIAANYGFDFKGAFNNVAESNMTKLVEPQWNESGKLLKGPHYIAPSLAAFI